MLNSKKLKCYHQKSPVHPTQTVLPWVWRSWEEQRSSSRTALSFLIEGRHWTSRGLFGGLDIFSKQLNLIVAGQLFPPALGTVPWWGHHTGSAHCRVNTVQYTLLLYSPLCYILKWTIHPTPGESIGPVFLLLRPGSSLCQGRPESSAS